ncbi:MULTISPECIES: RidA family protein [Rhizobium]|uniref:Enamine deaminase RidA (YjgF/YER057c/UK114 family) n=3 Tax=Rhizobium TaxID=379 RepID=A0A6P1CHU7_RHITR|nr:MULTISPECIES: RidA family protein [Rhizobium]AGB73442.1 endoribonuclease L-PSP [Rhizobium tropici CIAT 899]AYG70373.1 RidA family protein [Rhizobium sp. CCGE531]AYG76776.1 RidA family protein [Rhizobium sp. CCGE532]ENN88316.1 endoribonuclease L-PSP [Rhizobium freirei PRF 81]MBB4244812.1 enamine deaminase RidA (YjgF/YER057c/UK114 family) [Rhizobium tropici]
MSQTIEKRMAELGLELPEAAKSVANYLPIVASGNLILTSGQLPLSNGKLIATGLVGRELDVTAAALAARQCALNILAQAQAHLGSLDRIARIIKITVFVASAEDFTEQHLVANGASDVLLAVCGDKGKHARSAVGVAALPMNAPVEIEAMLEIDQ